MGLLSGEYQRPENARMTHRVNNILCAAYTLIQALITDLEIHILCMLAGPRRHF
jgi:hypothetical protein